MDLQEFNNSHEWQYFGHSGRIGFYLSLDWCWQTWFSEHHGNTTTQQNNKTRQNKQGNEANNKRHQKKLRKKGRYQYIAKYRTQILKEIPEHNLETHATACKYLNNSSHGKSLLRKESPQIVDMCDAFIWTIFNLFDLNCTIDSKVRIIFFNYSKVTYIHFIIPYSMDI